VMRGQGSGIRGPFSFLLKDTDFGKIICKRRAELAILRDPQKRGTGGTRYLAGLRPFPQLWCRRSSQSLVPGLVLPHRTSPMTPHVLYEIPVATVPVRLVMGGVCMLFVLAIFGWWLPRVVKYLRDRSSARNAVVIGIFLLPVALGFAPLIILFSLIRNPITYVTDAGVMEEGVFYGQPVSFAWSDINHVDCHSTRGGSRLRSMTLVASDGRRIEIGNASGVDIYSVRELLQNQLGSAAMHYCRQLRP